MLGEGWSEALRKARGDKSSLPHAPDIDRAASELLSELPPHDSWIKQGIVERRTVHANAVWRERKMILTESNIFFAKSESSWIMDKILIQDISYIGKVDHTTAEDEKGIQSSKLGGKTSILQALCRQDEFESFDAAIRKTFAFEIKTMSEEFQRSYFVRAQSLQECNEWIAAISLCIKSTKRILDEKYSWLEKMQRRIRKLQTNHHFRSTVAVAIILDFLSCVIKSELLPHHDSPLEHFFDTFDVVFFAFFAIELTLNVVGNWRSILGLPFVSRPSNWFQVATVAIQVVSFFDAEIRSLKVIRIMRIFDIGELFKGLASCHIVLKAIRRGSTPPGPPHNRHPTPHSGPLHQPE